MTEIPPEPILDPIFAYTHAGDEGLPHYGQFVSGMAHRCRGSQDLVRNPN